MNLPRAAQLGIIFGLAIASVVLFDALPTRRRIAALAFEAEALQMRGAETPDRPSGPSTAALEAELRALRDALEAAPGDGEDLGAVCALAERMGLEIGGSRLVDAPTSARCKELQEAGLTLHAMELEGAYRAWLGFVDGLARAGAPAVIVQFQVERSTDARVKVAIVLVSRS